MGNNNGLNRIIEDLKLLFKQEKISGEEFDEFLKKLKSEEVKHYLNSLKAGSKPERALKDVFFSHGSEFVKLFGKAKPEVFRVKTGFIDYIVERKGGKAIDLEIKPPFVAQFQEEKAGRRIFKGIKKEELNPKKYEDQIKKYLKTEGEYLIFTNLEVWCFFSDSYSRDVTMPYTDLSLSQFLREFKQIGDLYEFANRKEEEIVTKEPLDKKFFKSLDAWVKELRKVDYTVDHKTRNDLIINLINKLIFVQSLDKLWVGPYKYIERSWSEIEGRWAGRKKEILKEFLERTDNYFYKVYDTELFIEKNDKTIFDFVKEDKKNIEKFFKKLKLVLGVEFGATHVGWVNGIIQYNFRHINEDILGKAYEKYLARIRKEEGVYYTPKYITQYIVENTVGEKYDVLLEKIKKALEKENYDGLNETINEFTSIHVLDPACGSGSFLIKALILIWAKYKELIDLLNKHNKKYSNFKGTLSRSKEDEKKSQKLIELKKSINFKDKRDLISKIILRHIHGNDLDHRALEVAKVNIWLAAIKLIPTEFRYDQLPEDTNHILPDLEMNLGNGNSLVGLPEDETIKFLKDNHKEELKELFELRKKYLQEPSNEEPIKKIQKIKNTLRKELDKQFKQYLKDNNLPPEIFEKTIPFYWALDFWYVYFDKNLEIKNKELQGFDAIIGNPPYERAKIIKKWKEFYKKHFYTVYGACDIYIPFMEKNIKSLKKDGLFSFITSNKYLVADYGKKLRDFLYNHIISELIDLTECPSVFEEALISPLITISKNNKPYSDSKTKIIIFERDEPEKIEEIKEESINGLCSVEFRSHKKLKDNLTGHFNIYITPKIRNIIEKIYNKSQLFKSVSNIRTGIMGFDYHKMEPIISDSKEEDAENNLELIPPSLIGRYRVLWGKKTVKLFNKDFNYPRMKYDKNLILVEMRLMQH